MYSVIVDKKKYDFTTKITLEDLAKSLNKKCYVAKVNNRLRELSYYVNYNCEVEFLDLSVSEAVRVYQTTLRYIIIMALEIVDPDAKIIFNEYVSRTYMGKIINSKFSFNEQFLEKLKKEIDNIIKSDYRIERKKISIDEAIAIYQKRGYLDKCSVLRYREEKEVNSYICNGYINYMYGYMVPSTGYIENYNIIYNGDNFIIQYPRNEVGGQIPKFIRDDSFGKMIEEAQEWTKLCKVDNIASMNDFTSNRAFVNFVNMCETKHNNMLAELGMLIKENIANIKIIAIAGPSSSGKTTFSNRLKIELLSRGIECVTISMDDYYLDREDTPLDEKGKPDFENVNALDIKLFNQHLVDLIAGKEVTLPMYNFKKGCREQGQHVKLHADQPIIIEGIHALNEKLTSLVPRQNKFKIFISPIPQLAIDNHTPITSTDIRLLRRIVRDAEYRKISPVKTFEMWSDVRRGEFKWIYPWQKDANYVYNSSLTYEIMVLKKYALPVLKEIDKNDEYYIQANRLIKFLKYIKDIDDRYVPCNSILREFIGGSCFYE